MVDRLLKWKVADRSGIKEDKKNLRHKGVSSSGQSTISGAVNVAGSNILYTRLSNIGSNNLMDFNRRFHRTRII